MEKRCREKKEEKHQPRRTEKKPTYNLLAWLTKTSSLVSKKKKNSIMRKMYLKQVG
jgi:hypothetical protein